MSVLEEPGWDTNLGLTMADSKSLHLTATSEPAAGFVGVKCAIRPQNRRASAKFTDHSNWAITV